MIKKKDVLCFASLIIALVPLEIVSGFLAYETIGAIVSGIYFLIIAVSNLLAIIVAVRSRKFAAIITITVAMIIIPYQAILGYRLLLIEQEVTHISTYANKQMFRQGAFPNDLSGYKFKHPEASRYISYTVKPTQNHFTIYYFVGVSSTSHWYDSQTGWGYYPD